MKVPQYKNLKQIRLVVDELFHAGGRTDMTKLRVAFRNLANAYKEIDFFFSLDDIL
jgi:hypothetical protein